MGSESKKHAKAKFDNMHIKIGFPDKWKDYTALSINSDDLIGNVIHIKEFNYNQDLDTLGKPVDKSKWYMPLQMVNAYYNPEMNEIVFPAAIFQPPFLMLMQIWQLIMEVLVL